MKLLELFREMEEDSPARLLLAARLALLSVAVFVCFVLGWMIDGKAEIEE